MKTSIALEKIIVQYFQSSHHQMDLIAKFVLSVIQVKRVALSQIATSLQPTYGKGANDQRIQRFIAEYSFDTGDVVSFDLAQLPRQHDLVLCIDRTNWKFGLVNINIMALGIAYRGTAFNLMWVLPKQGNSNQGERIDLLGYLLSVLPLTSIKAIIADREFIGQDWFRFLHEQDLNFHIRLRKNMLAELEA